jgi:hypothetical protein
LCWADFQDKTNLVKEERDDRPNIISLNHTTTIIF